MKFDFKFIAVILLILLAISVWIISTGESRISLIQDGKELSDHWSCMDGCYNMLLVIYGNVTYDNKNQESYHSECSDMCFGQKMVSLADFKSNMSKDGEK